LGAVPDSPNVRTSLNFLCEAIAAGQLDDPFAPVTVVVPSPYVRVQLRREVGLRRGLCNVSFRTWGEVTSDLARSGSDLTMRIPSPRTVNESLRQVLRVRPGPFESFARSPVARAELVALFQELWRVEPTVLRGLSESGGRVASLIETLHLLDDHLDAHGFTNLGRVLDLAALGAAGASGVIVRWYPRADRSRDRSVLSALAGADVLVATISGDPGAGPLIDPVFACSDPDEEVRVVLRELVREMEGGVPLWRQAIVHPPADRYRRIVHQQLADGALPSSGRGLRTLGQSATGRALLGAVGLVASGWKRDAVMNWLGCAPITNGRDGLPVPVRLWDDISARAGVTEGLDQWQDRLARFAGGGDHWDVHVAHGKRDERGAASLSEYIETLAADVSRPCGRWSEWSEWASGMLRTYLDPEHQAEGWPRSEQLAARQVQSLLDDLGALDQVASEADLTTFRHAVEEELSTRRVRDDAEVAVSASEDDGLVAGTPDHVALPGPFGSGVFVGTPYEARGLSFDRVYVVGLADQYFPGTPGEGSLFAESEVDDPDWPTAARAVAELLDDVRSIVGLADAAVGSMPRVDPRTGRELGRSRWLDETYALASQTETPVASFAADIESEAAETMPLSGDERLLSSLSRAVRAGRTPESEPAVVECLPAPAGVPALGRSFAAARAPLTGGFTAFEGNVGTGEGITLPDTFAPTQLEDYAACPRRYLFRRLLKLNERIRPEATEEMAPADRGSLVHDILARYVRGRLDGAPRDLDRLLAIADECFSLAEQEGRCGAPVIARVERSVLMREMRQFFEEDLLEPVEVELSFGETAAAFDVAEDRVEGDKPVEGPALPALEFPLGGGRTVRFIGRLDRIDRRPDGTPVVSDYKSGKQSTLVSSMRQDPLGFGTRLQLPIYGRVAAAFLGWKGSVRTRYWLTSLRREKPQAAYTIDEKILERLRSLLDHITTGITTGVFPGVPGDETYRPSGPTFDHCVHCPFDMMCPVDRDRRWAAEEAAPELAAVVALGEPPEPDLGSIVDMGELELR